MPLLQEKTFLSLKEISYRIHQISNMIEKMLVSHDSARAFGTNNNRMDYNRKIYLLINQLEEEWLLKAYSSLSGKIKEDANLILANIPKQPDKASEAYTEIEKGRRILGEIRKFGRYFSSERRSKQRLARNAKKLMQYLSNIKKEIPRIVSSTKRHAQTETKTNPQRQKLGQQQK